VVGGGNTAVEEALFLTNFASKVTLVHRRDSLRAEKIMQDRLFKNPKVEVLWNHTIDEVVGAEDPAASKAWSSCRNGRDADHSLRGLLRGHRPCPATELVKDQLEMHNGGYVKVEPAPPAHPSPAYSPPVT
jgi:thioredoxin reductase (NADPH)